WGNRRRGRRPPQSNRRPGVRRSTGLRCTDRAVLATVISTVLHDILRQLSGGDGTRTRNADCRLQIAELKTVICNLPWFNLQSAILNLQSAISPMITLTLKEQPTVPLEAEVLSPDVMAGLGHDAIRALPVLLGKRQCRLEDFFKVEGAASEDLEIRGDAGKVKWIGRGMTRG